MTSIDDNLATLGITPVGSETFEPFSLKEIGRIEEMIRVQLPETYKRFVMKYGNSMFSTGADSTPSEKPVNYCCFFGFEELLTAIECLKETLPETIIPIGDDSGDIVLCLGVSRRDMGKVYIHNSGWGWHADAERYLERGEPVPSDIRYQAVHQVAPSFEEFVKIMKKDEEAS
jgi:SMI1-KNR4 cell-wall